MLGLLISGWHKSQGHTVVLTDEVPNFNLYDLVYIMKDAPELVHDPQWLKEENVIPVGKYWNIPTEWNDEWEEALPDKFLYQNWAQNWMKKYPTIAKERMEPFFREPIKIKQKNHFKIPEGENLLIIDNDMHIWDKDGEILSSIPMIQGKLLYPLQLDGRWEAGIKIFSQRHLKRQNFWSEFQSTISFEEMAEAVDLLKSHSLGRLFRIRMHSWAYSHEEWKEELKKTYYILEYFRLNAGKKIWSEPHNIHLFEYPRILKELKRWTAMNGGYNKNSLFTYIIFDGCRSMQFMTEFFKDPYTYVENKRFGSNKFKELIPFMENEPELMDIITTSYSKAGY